MPTYDYVCEKCEHEFEFFQSMSDDRLTDCPVDSCDGAVKRKIGTGAGIIFKGSGFYETDNRSESYKKGQKKESDSGSDKAKTDSGSKSSGGDSGGGATKSSGGETKTSSSGGSSSKSSTKDS